MKVKATALALALAGIAAAGSAQAGVFSESASAFSYDNVGVNYTETESDSSEANRDGFGVEGSISVSPNFYVVGELDFVEEDVEEDEFTNVRLGTGYHRDLGLSVPSDFVAEVGVTAIHQEDASGEGRDFAWDASVGARTSLGIQGLDATAYIGMSEKIDENSEYEFGFKYGVGADYFLTTEVSVGAEYEVQKDGYWASAGEEDLETLSFGVKYHL